MTANQNVVVELVAFGAAKEYCEVSLAEAKEILARKTNPGWHWHVPAWQFNEDGSALAIDMQDRVSAILAEIEKA